MKRKIIKIDEKKCNGCGLCLPNCPEGALQVIDGKVRLVSDLYCDGLGACLGFCPLSAITIEEREAEEYDEMRVMKNIVREGKNVIKAHLKHLKEHNQNEYFKQALVYLKENGIENPFTDTATDHSSGQKQADISSGCPGSAILDFREKI